MSLSRPRTSHCGDRLVRIQAVLAHEAAYRVLRHGAVLVGALEFALDERAEPALEELHRLADAIVIGDGHGSLLRSRAVSSGNTAGISTVTVFQTISLLISA